MSETTKAKTTCSFLIPPKYLKAIAAFASKDETRYVLNGVCVDRHNNSTILVATDGRRLGAVELTDEIHDFTAENFEPFIIPASLIQSLPKPSSAYNGRIRISLNGSVSASASKTVSVDPIDGIYPKWKHVIPSPSAYETRGNINVNLDLLSDFPKAIRSILGTSGVTISAKDEMSPILIRAASASNKFIGVIMPVRMEPSAQLPEWATA